MPNPVLVDCQFWLQVMGDHAIIIYENLAPLEAKEIQQAQEFIRLFHDLLAEAQSNLTDEQVGKLIPKALKATIDIRDYKMKILARQLTDHIRLTLSTGMINHFINETNEYIYILERYTNNTAPKFHPVHYHLIWLRDGMTHANMLESYASFPFKDIVNKAATFVDDFQILYNKALEFGDYMRTGLKDFPAIGQLSRDAYELDKLFAEFIVDLQLKITDQRVVMPLTLLIVDHMYREECYYLTQLAIVTKQNPPPCDPAAPRKLIQA